MEPAVQRLIDRQAIVDVIHAYCRGVDTIDVALLSTVFADNCVVDYGPGLGGPTVGAAEVVARLASGLPRFASTLHRVSNVDVTFTDADVATGIAYVDAWHRYPDDRPDAVVRGCYHDRFIRVADGGWRIAERILRVAGDDHFGVDWYPVLRGG